MFCLIWDLLSPQSLSTQQDEKPGWSVCFIWPPLTEEQADKGQLLFHLLAQTQPAVARAEGRGLQHLARKAKRGYGFSVLLLFYYREMISPVGES